MEIYILGYDSMIKEQGINLLFDQLEETKKELEIIIQKNKSTLHSKKNNSFRRSKTSFSISKTGNIRLKKFP